MKWSDTKIFDVAPFIEWLQVLTATWQKIQQTNTKNATNTTNKCKKQTQKQMQQNKLASLGATLVRNYDWLTDLMTYWQG